MNSSAVYAIASECSTFANNIAAVIQELETAKSAVNTDQTGKIPDAISNKLDKLISNLVIASSNMASASGSAYSYARQLEEEERRRAAEEAARRNSRKK